MPVYTQPIGFNTLPEVVVSGKPAYLYGALATDTQDTIMQVSNVALTSNVATLTVQIQGGNIPIVGQLVSVQGTASTSGLFNVTNAVLTGVTITASTGAGTITFALIHADVVSIANTGKAYVPIQEVSEAVAANTSVAVYVPSQEPQDNGQRTITVATTFPVIQATTGAATVTLYTAINNTGIAPGSAGAEWTSMGVVAIIAAGAQTAGPLQTYTIPAGRFFCVQVTGVTGTNKLICKLIS